MVEQTKQWLERLVNPSHALFVKMKPYCDLEQFITLYVQKIFWTNGINNQWINDQIQARKYLDWFEVDGRTEMIKKGQINAMMEQFSRRGVEPSGIKIAILKNFDQANEIAFNTLLRFLENPPPKTYLILTTNDQELIPVIASRCQRMILQSEPLDNHWQQAFYSVTAYRTFWESPEREEIMQWLEIFQKHQQIKQSLETFKRWEYTMIKTVLTLCTTIGTEQFQAKVRELIEIMPINPAKSLLFFELWENW